MRLRQALAGVGDAEIAVLRVGAQAVGLEIFLAVMTDGDALLRTSAFGGGLRARLGLAILGLDLFSRCGFGGGPVGNALARAIFSARRCGPRPAMSASAWPSHASLIRGAPGCRKRRSREVSHSSATRQRTLPLARFAASALMQPEHAVDGAEFGGLDQLGMGHRHGEQRSLQRSFPEAEKILQRRKFREQIVILPDVSLQQ